MPWVLIDDLDDPRIAPYRHLKANNTTRRTGLFVVEGEKLVDRLIESRYPVASVLAGERHVDRIATKVPSDIPLFVLPHALLSLLVGFNFHQGVLACGRRCPAFSVAEVAEKAGDRLSVVVCPTLNNPENLGAIVRIADVFGVDAVLVGGRCPDPLSRRVLRVSMGTSLRLPVIASEAIEVEIDELQTRWNVELIATVVGRDAERLSALPRLPRVALFLGSESDGLEPEWIERCGRKVTIPMRAGAESLNVAVAAGIILYHLLGSGSEYRPITQERG
jgi:tRNA G18 (ribose-2'-O)-methylase SpoU